MTTSRLVNLAALSLLACTCLRAQQAAGGDLESFTVLRTGRLIAPSETATNADTHCAIVGTGGAATMQCNPAQATIKTSYHYNTALIVDAKGTGYVVACREALITNLWCKKADSGTVMQGRFDKGHLSITDGQKLHEYQLLTSAEVGAIPMAAAAPAPAAPAKGSKNQVKAAPVAPSVAAAAAAPSKNPPEAPSSEQAGACTLPAAACVSFASEPQGADIYIDGKFAGNTPSMLTLTPGSHEVRIESAKLKPWTRTLETTAGSKITVHATLESSTSTN